MQQFPITVQSQRPRLAAVKPLALGKPGDFLCPALAARGWAGRMRDPRQAGETHLPVDADAPSLLCRGFRVAAAASAEGQTGARPDAAPVYHSPQRHALASACRCLYAANSARGSGSLIRQVPKSGRFESARSPAD